MAKKPIRDDSTFLGFIKVNGVRVPFYDDDKPLDLEENLYKGDSMTMCLAPDRKQPSPKPKRR